MANKKVSGGVVHKLPKDLLSTLVNDPEALEFWEDITELARNEWICWVGDAKKAETRQRRIERVANDLKNGKRRPCCWPGCSHRERTGKA
ncbi:YdeI/OmpD-associated family protein [Kangiella sp. M94]